MKKNYLMELRDFYFDKPILVLKRFIVLTLLTLVIHFLLGGENYLHIAIGSLIIFTSAWLVAFGINCKWPRSNEMKNT